MLHGAIYVLNGLFNRHFSAILVRILYKIMNFFLYTRFILLLLHLFRCVIILARGLFFFQISKYQKKIFSINCNVPNAL